MQEFFFELKDFEIFTQEHTLDVDQIISARISLHGEEKISTKLLFKHISPNIQTRIDFRFVLYDKSSVDIEAIAQVEKGIKNIDTYLSIRALIIGEKARARVIPSIEISENNVKGGHGATIGYINTSQMHYLQSRGLSKIISQGLLIESFLS